jgi:4-diphosphocytidyl-2-C-methyl-D-erythritol kinase
MKMKIKAYAKINIALDIVGKRDDGYHLLRMIMQTIDLYDIIEINKINSGIELNCNKHYVPIDERNLAYKAAKLFKETYYIDDGVHIELNKNIPVSAGLAGGSTNAAGVLKLMNKIFDINANDDELRALGLKLGADVPYCISGGTALCEGVGEQITQLKPFNDKILILIKPPFGVSTKEVYKNFDLSRVIFHPRIEELIDHMENDDIYFVANNMKNLLENVTLKKHRVISSIKEQAKLNGSIGTMMSGSGPTVFAFFDDMLDAQKCYDDMKKKYKDVFITRTI